MESYLKYFKVIILFVCLFFDIKIDKMRVYAHGIVLSKVGNCDNIPSFCLFDCLFVMKLIAEIYVI